MQKFEVHFDDHSGDKWYYDWDDNTDSINCVNLKNCLFRNTLAEFWVTKIISNGVVYKTDDEITNFLKFNFKKKEAS